MKSNKMNQKHSNLSVDSATQNNLNNQDSLGKDNLVTLTKQLSNNVNQLTFSEPVTHVYNPLDYAWASHEQYLLRFGEAQPVPRKIMLLGMNPGPFGMAQVGVPFGEIDLVKNWMGITGQIDKPANEHPKRPVTGFACTRSEVSGRRVWSWAAERFGTPESFFETFYMANYCPLVFMEESGRNRTPDKLPKAERDALYDVCDQALVATLNYLQPQIVMGVGRFAYDKAVKLIKSHQKENPSLDNIECMVVAHPSPASPIANRGWAPLMDAAIDEALLKLS